MQDTPHFTQRDRDTLIKVETKLDRAIQDISNISNNLVSQRDLADVSLRVKNLEDNQKWLVRTVGGALILALCALVISVN